MAGSSSSPVSSAAPQSPIAESTNDINTNTAASHSISQSAKKGRGRPRKYHTDAEREEAKRRYRENHKTKAATGSVGVSGANSGAASTNFAAVDAQVPVIKQQDVDGLWQAVRGLQAEVAGLKMQLAQRDAADAAALPGQKRRKVLP